MRGRGTWLRVNPPGRRSAIDAIICVDMTTIVEHSDLELWSRVVEPQNPDMSPDAARGILALRFTDTDQERVRALGEKANEGTLSAQERSELESYVRVGKMLALLQSKARRSLGRGEGPGEQP